MHLQILRHVEFLLTWRCTKFQELEPYPLGFSMLAQQQQDGPTPELSAIQHLPLLLGVLQGFASSLQAALSGLGCFFRDSCSGPN